MGSLMKQDDLNGQVGVLIRASKGAFLGYLFVLGMDFMALRLDLGLTQQSWVYWLLVFAAVVFYMARHGLVIDKPNRAGALTVAGLLFLLGLSVYNTSEHFFNVFYRSSVLMSLQNQIPVLRSLHDHTLVVLLIVWVIWVSYLLEVIGFTGEGNKKAYPS